MSSKKIVLRGVVTNAPLQLTRSVIFGLRLPDRTPLVVFVSDEDLAKMTLQSVKVGNKVIVAGSHPSRNNKVCVSADFIGLDINFGINVQMDPDEIFNVGGSVYNPNTDPNK